MKATFWFFAAAAIFWMSGPLPASEPVTLDNLVEPEANSADEPLAPKFSMERAADFLDSASLNWQRTWKCFTCHTNVSYLMARPLVSSSAPAHLKSADSQSNRSPRIGRKKARIPTPKSSRWRRHWLLTTRPLRAICTR